MLLLQLRLPTSLYGISLLPRSPGLKPTNLGSGAEKQQAATRRKMQFWRQRWVCYTAGLMAIFTVSNARTFTWSFATKIVMWRSQVYFILDSNGRDLDQYLILVLLLLLGSQILLGCIQKNLGVDVNLASSCVWERVHEGARKVHGCTLRRNYGCMVHNVHECMFLRSA